jgi:hypothetical protein
MVWTDLSTARIVRFHEASCVVEDGDRERFQKRKSCLLPEPVSTASAINEPARVPTISSFSQGSEDLSNMQVLLTDSILPQREPSSL